MMQAFLLYTDNCLKLKELNSTLSNVHLNQVFPNSFTKSPPFQILEKKSPPYNFVQRISF